jgi:hypothetical protein
MKVAAAALTLIVIFTVRYLSTSAIASSTNEVSNAFILKVNSHAYTQMTEVQEMAHFPAVILKQFSTGRFTATTARFYHAKGKCDLLLLAVGQVSFDFLR